MPAIQQTANASGALLWTEAKHKKATLTGLTVDNQAAVPETIKLYDCFTAVSGYWVSGGAVASYEDLGSTNLFSGKIRKQLTVPTGETEHLGDIDLKDLQFLGSVYVVAGTTDTGCVITAQYQLK